MYKRKHKSYYSLDNPSGWPKMINFNRLLTLAFTLVLLTATSQALAQQKKVTFVARECPDYTDVMANKARNNIMESLRDLGIDSTYSRNQAVSKAQEESVATQLDNCVPLNNWRFTLGSGFSSSKDTGSFGSLSKVKNVSRTTGVTSNSTNVLDSSGSPTGEKIDGAINLTLNSTELESLARGSLTVQGGQPGSPLLGSQVLGFATLRCGLDNLNADNVEFIRFPSNTSHTYCYAYYINPAPSAAKIIVRKILEGTPPSDSNPDFVFGGNVSFDSSGTFKLKAGGSEEFDRAAVSPENPAWTINEEISNLPQGYKFKSVSCSTEGAGGSTSTVSGAQVSIDLKAGDKVTCSFINTYTPPAAQVNISPILECTSRSAVDQYTGHFGYFSRETDRVIVPPGASNQLIPAPANRGQPYSFEPGRFARVFSAGHSGSNLVWKLGSRTATSSSAAAQRCSPTCILPPQIQASECDPTVLIDGTESSTLNNGGTISSFSWSTNCDGTLLNTDTLRPTLLLDLADSKEDKQKCQVRLQVTDDTQFGTSDPQEIHSSSCSAEVSVPNCATDCAGIPNGNTEVDQCGVCGGNNSSCLDCEGVPNGGAVPDKCGVCGGNNSTCSDCAGVPNGSAAVDNCGVCGGDGSSCSGVCTESDIDACGVCFGSSSTCLDCSGIPNGGTQVDACGVCGGDGSFCSQCISSKPPSNKVKRTTKEVARDIKLLVNIADKYSKEAVNCNPDSASKLKADAAKVAEIAELINQEISDIHVDVDQICSNQTCINVSLVSVEDGLKSLTKAIRKLILDSKKIVSKCRAPIPDSTSRRKSRDIAKDIIASINSLPDEVLTCSK